MTYWQTLDAERGIWCHEYAFDGKGGTANALALRLRDGELLVVSPPSDATEAAFAELDGHGKVVALVAPNGFHHLGQPAFQKRYPDAGVYAPAAASKRIAKKATGIAPGAPLEELQRRLPDDVWVGEPSGMKIGDVVVRAKTASGTFWYFNDLVMNLRKLPSNFLFSLAFKWTDSGPGFKVARLIVKFLVRDRAAFKGWLLEELRQHPPTAVLTGHGPPILDSAVAGRLPQMVEDAV